ncbi:hypothetical protein BpHYR1_006691 [Brachionus plicatilis]|uniref:Uncharacterized protein n=1 Tax=Brachionus plicatilis TaxID=10195 RepID=A0A3M7P6A5_BRAPC|nr:hypothetical protein BpHYR1_006691 [Brachionus plicatilis]
MEHNLKNYQKIVVDHYESLMNDVDLYYENLKQGEFNSERKEITKKIKEYREKNLNQLNNVKIDEENFDNLFPFEKRELLDRLIFKDECVSSIVSSDFRKILIIYPCYLSGGAKWSLR